MTLVSVSSHALARYRIHYPNAERADVRLAAAAGPEIPATIAHNLAGRPTQTSGDQIFRVHPDGNGIFVLCPLPSVPDGWYVKTYLRWVSAEQRRMVQDWYLQPIQALERAFELGFLAAAAYPTPSHALAAHRDALTQLGPLAAGPRPPASEADDPPAAPEPVPPATALPLTAQAREHWSWFQDNHPDIAPDLAAWLPLPPSARPVLRAWGHLQGTQLPPQLLLEPAAIAVAFVDDPPRVTRLVNVPRADRERLLAFARPAPR